MSSLILGDGKWRACKRQAPSSNRHGTNHRFDFQSEYSITNTLLPEVIKLSFTLNPIFLSRRDGVRSGGNGNLCDGRSELVVDGFSGLMRAGAILVPRIPIVWREGTRYRGLEGGRFQY